MEDRDLKAKIERFVEWVTFQDGQGALHFRFDMSQAALHRTQGELNEVDDLQGVSARLEKLAEQYPPVTEALMTISGNVLNSATVLAVVAAIKSPKPN